MAEVLAGGDIGRVVVEEGRAAFFYEGAHGLALCGSNPLDGPLFQFGSGRITKGAMGVGIIARIRCALAVAVGPDHAVAEDDE